MTPVRAPCDERTTYTPRPGTCVSARRAFCTVCRVNAPESRDNEASPDAPKAVTFRDPMTMGWGVEHLGDCPSVVESLTGSCMSGAGGCVLAMIDADACRCTVQGRPQAPRCVPVACAFNVLAQLQSATRGRTSMREAGGGPNGEQHAAGFNQQLRHSPANLSRVDGGVGALSAEYIAALRKQTAVGGERWIAAIQPVGAGIAMRFAGDFYVLDDHVTAPIQLAIGQTLADALAPAIPM